MRYFFCQKSNLNQIRLFPPFSLFQRTRLLDFPALVYSQKISTTKEKNSADVSAASARFSIFGSKVAKIVGRRCWNLRVPDPDPARSVIPHQSQHHRLDHHHQDQELNENQKLFIIVKYGRKVNKHSNICSLLVIIVLKTNRMIMKTMILMIVTKIFYYRP